MDDRDFDRRLTQRLRAYESRLPEDEAPDPRTIRSGAGPRWPMIAGVLGAGALAGVLAGALLLNRPSAPVGADGTPEPSVVETPRPSEVSTPPTQSASPIESPSATPAPTEPPATTDLEWTETASFGTDTTMERVASITAFDGGYVAVGTFLDALYPSVFGMAPHAGRVWLSVDRRAWEAVSLPDHFDNAELTDVYVAADGGLLAVGSYGHPANTGGATPAAWESRDGRQWQPTASGLPADRTVGSVQHGDRGYVALLRPLDGAQGDQLWISTDGRQWEDVYVAQDGNRLVDVGAGPQGFVALGQRGESGARTSFAIASADGGSWLEGSEPPMDALAVAPLGGDWIAASARFLPSDGEPSDLESAAWLSPNGLDWTEAHDLALDTVQIAPDTECTEYPSEIHGTGRWLVLSPILTYTCSEGGFIRHGTPRLSTNGRDWVALAFPQAGMERRFGSGVFDAIETDDGLILVGESNARATFWIGEAP